MWRVVVHLSFPRGFAGDEFGVQVMVVWPSPTDGPASAGRDIGNSRSIVGGASSPLRPAKLVG